MANEWTKIGEVDEDVNFGTWEKVRDLSPGDIEEYTKPKTTAVIPEKKTETVVLPTYRREETPTELSPDTESGYVSRLQDPNIPLEEINVWLRDQAIKEGRPVQGRAFDFDEAQKYRDTFLSGQTTSNEVSYDNSLGSVIKLPEFKKEEQEQGWGPAFQRAYQDATQYGFAGMVARGYHDFMDTGSAQLAQMYPDATPEQLEVMQTNLVTGIQRQLRERGVEATADDPIIPWLAGQLLASGGPEDLIPFVSGASMAGRFAQAAGSNAAIDLAYQGADIQGGVQDAFNPVQATMAPLIGVGFHGVLELGSAGVRRVLNKGVDEKGTYIDVETNEGSAKRVYRGKDEKPQDIPEEAASTAFEGGEVPSFLKNPVKAKGYSSSEPRAKRGKDEGITESGVGQRIDETTARKDELTAGWKNAPEFLIVNNVDDLDDRLASEITADKAEGALGVTLPDGRVLLMTDNIKDPAQVDAVIFHEALGHVGLNTQFGDELDDVLMRIYEGNKKLKEDVENWQKANPEAYGGSVPRAIEEILAEGSEGGAIPKSVMDSLKVWVMKWARKAGLAKNTVTDAEVREILRQAHERIINGDKAASATIPGMRFIRTWHASSVDFDDFDNKFLLSGEGAMVFGDGHYSGTSAPTRKKYIKDAYSRNLHGEKSYVMSERGQPIVGKGKQDFTDKLATLKQESLSQNLLGKILKPKKLFTEEELSWWASKSFSSRDEAFDLRLQYRDEVIQPRLDEINARLDYEREANNAPHSEVKELYNEANRYYDQDRALREQARTANWNEENYGDPRAVVYELELPDEDWINYEVPMSQQSPVVQKAFEKLYRSHPKIKEWTRERRFLNRELLDIANDIDELELRLAETPEEDIPSQEMLENDIESLYEMRLEVQEELWDLQGDFAMEPMYDGIGDLRDASFLDAQSLYFDAKENLFGGEEMALSNYLNKEGVPGIALADGPSRGLDEDITYNYISFNPEEMKIVNKFKVSPEDRLTPPTLLPGTNLYMKNSERIPSKLKLNPGKQKQRGMIGNVSGNRFKSKRAVHPVIQEAAETAPEMTRESFASIDARAREMDLGYEDIVNMNVGMDPAEAHAVGIALVRKAEKVERLAGHIARGEATDQQKTDFGEAFLELSSIYETYAGIANNAGRLLAAFKIAKQSSSNERLRFMREDAEAAVSREGGLESVARSIHQGEQSVGRSVRETSKGADALANALNLPRTLMSSVDLSAPLRQGIVLAGTLNFYKSFFHMFRFMGSQRAFDALNDSIIRDPNYLKMREAGLNLTTTEGHRLDLREEDFQSEWAKKIWGLGKLVAGSERAYVGFLNKLRADTFNTYLKNFERAGHDINDPRLLKSMGSFINSATGRGPIPKKYAGATPLLNGLFFSPRLITSRAALLNPVYYGKMAAPVRKEAIKSMLGFIGIATTTMALAEMGGLDVEKDPRSSDFAKIRDGTKRYDILGGFGQFITLFARIVPELVMGEGKTKTIKGDLKDLEPGFASDSAWDVTVRFFRNKASPVASWVIDNLHGENALGERVSNLEPFIGGPEGDEEPIDWNKNAIVSRLTPIFLQDLFEVINEEGIEGIPYLVPSVFGIGHSDFDAVPSESALREENNPDNPAVREVGRLAQIIGKDVFGEPGRKVNLEGDGEKSRKLTDEEYKRYVEIADQYILEDLTDEIGSEMYSVLTDEEKVEVIKDVVKDARKAARETLADELYGGITDDDYANDNTEEAGEQWTKIG